MESQKVLQNACVLGVTLACLAAPAYCGTFLMTNDLNSAIAGVVSNNNTTAANEGHAVTADSLANITAMSIGDLLAFDVVWINPPILFSQQPYYDNISAAVTGGGSLEQYAAGGGVLVICVAGSTGNQTDIAPGGLDALLTIDVFGHEDETFTTPAHPYITGAGYGGNTLITADFHDWSFTDFGQLTNLPGGATTILSNTDGPSLIEYSWGCGQVIVNTLAYGWTGAGTPESGPAAENLINYADFLDSGPDADGDNVPDACDTCPGFDDNGPDSDSDGVPFGCDRCEGFDDNGLDSDNDGTPDACDDCTLPGDINCDGTVDLLDLRIMAMHWLETV